MKVVGKKMICDHSFSCLFVSCYHCGEHEYVQECATPSTCECGLSHCKELEEAKA